jgi:hypothetical protein
MRRTTIANVKKNESYDEWIGKGSQWEAPSSVKNNADYEKWLLAQSWLTPDISLLRGKALGCSCGNPETCHGVVLARLADETAKDLPEVWSEKGTWYILYNDSKICMNTEDTAKMLLRLLKGGK